jgi:hypothetical protein
VKRERPQPPPAEWRMRRAMQLYAAGEPIVRIASQVGWSEGRARKVLRDAGVVVADGGRDGSHEEHEEGRRRLLEVGWEARGCAAGLSCGAGRADAAAGTRRTWRWRFWRLWR